MREHLRLSIACLKFDSRVVKYCTGIYMSPLVMLVVAAQTSGIVIIDKSAYKGSKKFDGCLCKPFMLDNRSCVYKFK